jgi:NAD(P)-dependent dehydrogenase (short-subunit alcohol dehydrogenase family)
MAAKMTKRREERVAVVTGASSGIGKAAAAALAARAWHVIALGRDAERMAAAAADIRAAAAPGARIDLIRGDLTRMSDTTRMADEIAALTDEIHVLLNNAGGVRAERVITEEGNEATFAGNHLGHFLLTSRLMARLRSAAAASGPNTVRVLSVSSNAHESCPGIDWNDLQQAREWTSGKSYCLAKLCNILFTRELARRAAADGIIANVMHPGVVSSNFPNHAEPRMRDYILTLKSVTPEVGADTLVWLATAPEAGLATGGYFQNRQLLEPSHAAQDDAAAARLWKESEALISRAGAKPKSI